MNMHFQLDMLPPVSRVFATTVKAGAGEPGNCTPVGDLGIPGAILQAILADPVGQVGILFARDC